MYGEKRVWTNAGQALMNWALDWARAHGLRRIEFWSDTRFTRAHTFFIRNGFARDGRVREMNAGHMPYREYFFDCELHLQIDSYYLVIAVSYSWKNSLQMIATH